MGEVDNAVSLRSVWMEAGDLCRGHGGDRGICRPLSFANEGYEGAFPVAVRN